MGPNNVSHPRPSTCKVVSTGVRFGVSAYGKNEVMEILHFRWGFVEVSVCGLNISFHGPNIPPSHPHAGWWNCTQSASKVFEETVSGHMRQCIRTTGTCGYKAVPLDTERCMWTRGSACGYEAVHVWTLGGACGQQNGACGHKAAIAGQGGRACGHGAVRTGIRGCACGYEAVCTWTIRR